MNKIVKYLCRYILLAIPFFIWPQTILSTDFEDARFRQIKNINQWQGLLENTVQGVTQDTLGFMWIATRGGLHRFDGQEMVAYTKGSSGLASNVMTCLLLDEKGNLWVGSQNGLALYLAERDSFKMMPLLSVFGKPQEITALTETSDYLWVGSANGGLTGIHKASHTMSYSGVNCPFSRIYSLCSTPNGELWLSTPQGLFLFNEATREFTRPPLTLPGETDHWKLTYIRGTLYALSWNGLYYLDGEDFKRFPNRNSRFNQARLTSMSEDSAGNLWVGSDGDGLFIIPAYQRGQVYHWQAGSSRSSLSGNAILTIFHDKDGNVWIGHVHQGVDVLLRDRLPIGHISSDDKQKSLPDNNVSTFFKDRNNTLWVGTFGGLVSFSYPSFELKERVKGDYVINCLAGDSCGTIWAGTYTKGVVGYDTQTGRVFNLDDLPWNPFAFRRQYIGSMAMEPGGTVLIGGSGLYRIDPGKKAVSHLKGAAFDGISSILVLPDSSFWCGMSGKICLLNKQGNLKNSFSIGKVTAPVAMNTLCLGPDSSVFVGTNGNGLYSVKVNGKEAPLKVEHPDLPEVIHGISYDEKRHLWITSNKGLFSWDMVKKKATRFTFQEGLQSNQFIDEALLITPDGMLLAGGVRGFNFAPLERLRIRESGPKVLLTQLSVNQEKVTPGDDNGVLSKALPFTKDIRLSHKQSNVAIKVCGIDFTNPQRCRYYYRLRGFQDQWIPVPGDQTIQLMNLPTGTYTFEVKGENEGGKQVTKPALLTVTVDPPPWKTLWAYGIYLLVLFLLLWLVFKILKVRAHLKTSLEFEHRERKRIEELNEMKLRFFTNISHELRTPLTLILGPLQQLKAFMGDSSEGAHLVTQAEGQTRHLHKLVNQILDFRKIESGHIEVNLVSHDMIGFVKACCEAFQIWAGEKGLQLLFTASLKDWQFSFDQGLMEKVVYNLLSNAVKYTPDGGRIEVFVAQVEEQGRLWCEIVVKDTGMGLTLEERSLIFERFARGSQTNGEAGSGIGLALSREIAHIHGGTLQVASQKGEGSVFILRIPVNDPVSSEEKKEITLKQGSSEGPLILIVEDHAELRDYLGQVLVSDYTIQKSSSGEEALEVLSRELPDIVISDVMMPGMNGFELAHKLKGDIATSHIPVVLLTALREQEYVLKGLNVGVDAYLEKPFEPEHLKTVIRNILENRQRLKDRYGQDPHLSSEELALSKSDQLFLGKLEALVTEHLSEELSVEFLGQELGLSRSRLHAKVKALCGMPPSDFIRRIRLRQAVSLLQEGHFSLSEVAYQTGFSTPSYFSRCFKKVYGESPSSYLRQKDNGKE